MKNRTLVTLVVAGILVLVVMCSAAFMAFSGLATAEKYNVQKVWSSDFSNAQSMKIIDLTGDGQDDLFLQNPNMIQVLDAQGKELLARSFSGTMVSSMGDVNGDGSEDIVAFYSTDAGGQILALSKGEELWTAQTQLGEPSRVAVVRFASGAQVVAGDMLGNLEAFSAAGEPLWQASMGVNDFVRGLDDALVAGQVYLAAANHNGTLAVYDSQGQQLWISGIGGNLRRMRAYDLDGDGTSELVTGGENNAVMVFDAASGTVEAELHLGQTITEIRDAELNGDPASRELVVGGKEGGVWALSSSINQLWSGVASEKVTEIAAIDVNQDGKDDVLIGDDSGNVYLFTSTGERNSLQNRAAIMRIDVGKLGGERLAAVADANQVQMLRIDHQALPGFRFSPLLTGLLISAVILVTAWLVATMAPKPAERLTLQGQSAESLLANRRMLKESIADVERLKSGGEMTSEAYLLRLKELRELLAENDAALQKAGVKVQLETITCPNCGGKLQLGVDRCEYCGQVLL